MTSDRSLPPRRRAILRRGLAAALLACAPMTAVPAQDQAANPPAASPRAPSPREFRERGGTGTEASELALVRSELAAWARLGLGWYRTTPPAARVTWGGLVACSCLGVVVALERSLRLRRGRVVPADFTARFLDRLHEGKLDGAKALDYCEMNPSPAARVALAAVRRWGRPAVDLERAVTLAHRVEGERLRRNVNTLRRVAALAPLLGLLGTLTALGRVLESGPGSDRAGELSGSLAAWGPALASVLSPLTAGVAVATAALVAFDLLQVRIERLSGALDVLGAETIDAIAMATPPGHPAATSPLVPHRNLGIHAGHAGNAPRSTHAPHQAAPHRSGTERRTGWRSAVDHEIGS